MEHEPTVTADSWTLMAIALGRARAEALREGEHPDVELENAIRSLERSYIRSLERSYGTARVSQRAWHAKRASLPPDIAHFMDYLVRAPCPVHLMLTLEWEDGADLSDVGDNWIIELLTHRPQPTWPHEYRDYEVQETIAGLYRRRIGGDEPSDDEWTNASMSARITSTSALPAEAATVRNLDARLSHLACLAVKEAVNKARAWEFVAETLERLLGLAPVPKSEQKATSEKHQT